MRSFCPLLLLAGSAFAAAPTIDIKVDQVGYLSGASKVALVSGKTSATEFAVRAAQNGSIAFKGTLAAAADDAVSEGRLEGAVFPRLQKGEKYSVELPGVGGRGVFSIGPAVYSRAWYLAMRS